ncbi:MAG TPA: carboxylating nicotinate-nucleotide diphosphorylase [Candidatus Dormibacteraeota bacterium]|nr:carboxylating nicotinate-nucleotide diphosphorylase [Candidatus Dormibacteraeota bacterium]
MNIDWNSAEISELVRRALAEDVGSGDVTALATVPAGAVGAARILAREKVVVAGLPIAGLVFAALDPGMRVETLARDGDVAEKGRDLLRLAGSGRAILTGERTALNFLTHLSGIATLTGRFVDLLAGTGTRIRDTRKTIPGLRMLEKYAVKMGGGTNHRIGLYDAILLKENHIALAGGVKTALDMAHAFASSRVMTKSLSAYEAAGSSSGGSAKDEGGDSLLTVQVEVRNQKELREALGAGAAAVLLDNMTPAEARACVLIVRSVRPECVVEISGGINLENARAYAEVGADYLSSGMLTHSAVASNLSLLVESIVEG